MLGCAVLGPPGNTEVCQAMCTSGWQLVPAHMLHPEGVMGCTSLDGNLWLPTCCILRLSSNQSFVPARPIPEREIWRVGGWNTQILVCILCGVSGIESLRITPEMMSDYLRFFVPKTAKGCEVLCELRE